MRMNVSFTAGWGLGRSEGCPPAAVKHVHSLTLASRKGFSLPGGQSPEAIESEKAAVREENERLASRKGVFSGR